MKFFAILLCIAIGSVFGELERRNFAKEKLEITEDDNEVSSLISLDDDDDDGDRKTADSSDESLRVKYTNDNSLDQIAASAKDVNSVEQKTFRYPSPVIETSTVKPSSSKAKKKKLEKMRSEKAAKHFKELRKLTRRKSTGESQTAPVKEISANFLKRLLMSMRTEALGRKQRNLAISSRKRLRRKRAVEVEDPNDLAGSLIAYENLREKIPQQLKDKMRKTDAAEEELLQGYAESKGDMSNLVADYNAAKLAEREQLKLVATGSEATEVIDNYKAMRKGKPWNSEKLRGSLEGFLGKPSPSLTEYENLKQDEAASIDSFLGGSSNTGSEKKDTNEQSQEKEKPAEEKAIQEQPVAVEDPNDLIGSFKAYVKLREKLPGQLKKKMRKTDAVEEKLLHGYADSKGDTSNLVTDYNAAKSAEREQLKLVATGSEATEVISNYKAMRKGKPWNYIKLRGKFKGFLGKTSASLTEYENLKQDEAASIDSFLGRSSNTGSEKKDTSEEKMEEMKRGLRAKETEAVAVEYDANRENVETDISDAKGDTEAHGRLGNATSADVTNTETTKDRKTKHGSSYFLRFLILFAMVMQAIIAVLILAPLRDKLAEWCKRRKKTESGQAEKEPLQIKVFAVGPTSKSSKSPLNAARM